MAPPVLAALALLGCGGTDPQNTPDPADTATRYVKALDAGDPAQCDLSVVGKADRSKCEANAHTDAAHALVADPEAVATYDWTTPSGEQGKAVAVRVTLKANPKAPQIEAIGLVQRDGAWQVTANGWADSSDQTTTVGALS